ncbi:response regulator [Dictyobacter arantiisoli]|uniref:Response regulatory domain-containing protein n=1 Tax=Dictyobacter arantiisoli TaxID=2014874 RepID=A0A5A5TCG9_9CHLR|nr:response regulator [Dictyobacter arantiisoli]GCF08875.1 hypothetical protein KDI_24390 [Dictyobacter arantiisoli]
MSDVWRIVVVAGEDALNQNLVNALRKDGYVVQGALSGADAVRALWSEEYDVVICDLKTPGSDGFELLQWLRAYRPTTRMIMLGEGDAVALRMQALESGAVSYFEKPLDVRLLKEELRRLLQQTGFSASLDSFDLLDVIQIITMSRKSITLLINTGLEERGVLCFQNGELTWAEYGVLRGEEAFFALAAHKNGTVIQQPWNEQQGVANVTQPLSRLIFQALQYRTKYANQPQYSGEMETIRSAPVPFSPGEIDDTPFAVLTEYQPDLSPAPNMDMGMNNALPNIDISHPGREKEWWESTSHFAQVNGNGSASHPGQSGFEDASAAPTMAMDGNALNELLQRMGEVSAQNSAPAPALPGWLTDQPTSSQRAIVPPSPSAPAPAPAPIAGISSSAMHALPSTPKIESNRGDWAASKGQLPESQENQFVQTNQYPESAFPETNLLRPSSAEWGSSPHIKFPKEMSQSKQPGVSGPLPSLYANQNSSQMPPVHQTRLEQAQPKAPESDLQESNAQLSSGILRAQQAARRNYASLVSALQTLGYSISGFVAAAVVTVDGQPIAQVAIDDIDVSKICRSFSTIQRSVSAAALDQAEWGEQETIVITSAKRHLLLRMVGNENKAFQVLITTREANPTECLEVMANVDESISAALR